MHRVVAAEPPLLAELVVVVHQRPHPPQQLLAAQVQLRRSISPLV